jgi:hypothetical protein
LRLSKKLGLKLLQTRGEDGTEIKLSPEFYKKKFILEA